MSKDKGVIRLIAFSSVFGAVRDAEKKHPVFAANMHAGLCIIAEELGELAQAINDFDGKDYGHVREEVLHVAATAVRFLEMLSQEEE